MEEVLQNKLQAEAEAFLGTHEDWEKLTREEIELLRVRNFKSAEAVMRLKAPIATRYQKQLKHLFDHKEILKILPNALKAALRKAQELFDRISEEYKTELELALDASRRVMELIKSSIASQNTNSFFYGYSGAINPGAPIRSMVYNGVA